ncbi:MAG: FAD:protein FMN transferase [Kiritimatiellae bacterium]|nr:FAD:protein FMN transferase [Kiritimatiellia bacterium]
MNRNLFFWLLSGFLLGGCGDPDSSSKRVQWPTMGTIASVRASSSLSDATSAKRSCEAIFQNQEAIFSAWEESSELSRLNLTAGTGAATECSRDLSHVLVQALALCQESEGAFNPLIGSALRIWGFNGASPVHQQPGGEEIAEALRLADWRQLRTTRASPHSISLQIPVRGMKLDLGAIAKGYAVDLAYAALKSAGCSNLLINLGGNLRAIGEGNQGEGGWRTGIRDPFGKRQVFARFLLRDGEAVATSGNYERFVTIQGRRYAHIIDGRTGIPVRGMAGTTVVAPTAELADGLSTTLFILGAEKGTAFLMRHHPECRAIWIPDTGKETDYAIAGNWQPNHLEILEKP